MTNNRVLLDTTLQLHRIADHPDIRRVIMRDVYHKEVLTTSFVFREFLRTIVKDIIYVHLGVQSINEDLDGRVALANLDHFLASGKGNYSARSARRERLVTAAILSGFRQTRVSRQRLLVRLERTGQQWIRDFFEFLSPDGVTVPITCLTNLDDMPDELEQLKHGDPFPQMPSFPAGAARFLHNHMGQVRQAELAMRQARDNRDDALLGVLARLKNDLDTYDFLKRLTPRTRGNWYLGDLLIALETPPDAVIFTSDRHFGILGPALNKEVNRWIRPTPEQAQTILDGKQSNQAIDSAPR